jgi:peptidylprolyl isomerase
MKLSTKLFFGFALVGSLSIAYGYTSSNNNRRSFLHKSAVATTATIAGVSSNSILPKSALAEESTDPYADYTTTESGLKYKITKEGTGAVPSPGQTVKAHYTGWLDGFDSIKKFDSSRDRGRPFTFKVGAGQVIRGWDETFLDMKVGERRNIVIPSRLGYGDRGAGGIIPGGATLYFDVELLAIQ